MENIPGTDKLGLRPYGEALNTIVQKSFQAIEVFLGATCKPALDELGLMVGDKFRVYRLNNIVKILESSKDKFEFTDGEIQLKINPKVALNFMESASNEENEDLQKMWAGIFASSCDKDGTSDEDIMYINILKQLTLPEAKVLKYMCENTKKYLRENGLVAAQTVSPNLETLKNITGLNDITSIEILLNHLNSLRLNDRDLGGSTPVGFLKSSQQSGNVTWLTPTTLALQLYIKCMGFRGSMVEYWDAKPYSR